MSFLRAILGKTSSSLIHLVDLQTGKESNLTQGVPWGQNLPFSRGYLGRMRAGVWAQEKTRQFDSVLVSSILRFEAFSLSQCAEAQHRGFVLFMLNV